MDNQLAHLLFNSASSSFHHQNQRLATFEFHFCSSAPNISMLAATNNAVTFGGAAHADTELMDDDELKFKEMKESDPYYKDWAALVFPHLTSSSSVSLNRTTITLLNKPTLHWSANLEEFETAANHIGNVIFRRAPKDTRVKIKDAVTEHAKEFFKWQLKKTLERRYLCSNWTVSGQGDKRQILIGNGHFDEIVLYCAAAAGIGEDQLIQELRPFVVTIDPGRVLVHFLVLTKN